MMQASDRVLVIYLLKCRIELFYHESGMILKGRKKDIGFTFKVKVDQTLIHISSLGDHLVSCGLKTLLSKNGKGSLQNLLTAINARDGRSTGHCVILLSEFINYLTK